MFPKNDYDKVCFCPKWFLRLALHKNDAAKTPTQFFRITFTRSSHRKVFYKKGVLQKAVL